MSEIKKYKVANLRKEDFLRKLELFFKALGFLLHRLFIFILATSATLFFSILSILYTFIKYTITLKWTSGIIKFGQYVYQCALSTDQTGNVTCQEVFNDTMIKKNRKGHPFGEEDDTISYCLAKNGENKSLSIFGRFWYNFLNFVDRKDGGHMNKALESKDKKDFEAYERLVAKGLLPKEN